MSYASSAARMDELLKQHEVRIDFPLHYHLLHDGRREYSILRSFHEGFYFPKLVEYLPEIDLAFEEEYSYVIPGPGLYLVEPLGEGIGSSLSSLTQKQKAEIALQLEAFKTINGTVPENISEITIDYADKRRPLMLADKKVWLETSVPLIVVGCRLTTDKQGTAMTALMGRLGFVVDDRSVTDQIAMDPEHEGIARRMLIFRS